MDLSEAEKADLHVNRATTTPLWKGLATLVKYRTTRNYRNLEFLGPRVGDKIIFTLLVGTLYLGIGDKLKPDNYLNIGAVLFMWCTVPAYARLCYMHAIACFGPPSYPILIHVVYAVPILNPSACKRTSISSLTI